MTDASSRVGVHAELRPTCRRISALTRNALTNNSFNSVAELTDTIDTWAQNWNENPQPIAWTQPANDIIAKVKRGRVALTKSATDH